MSDRYYSDEPIADATLTLGGTEAHHLLHVMRAKPGLEIVVFDGQGGEFHAEVIHCQRSTVELAIGQRQEVHRELPFELTLGVAMPKGDRQRWLIEKAVEIGVTRLVPLRTKHTVSKNEKPTKLIRYVIAASKQCGRNRLMEIATPIDWPQHLAEATSGTRILAHPGGQPVAEFHSLSDHNNGLQIAIGPEGGFADEEVEQAVATGWQTVGLGERILRIETAAVALVSVFTMK